MPAILVSIGAAEIHHSVPANLIKFVNKDTLVIASGKRVMVWFGLTSPVHGFQPHPQYLFQLIFLHSDDVQTTYEKYSTSPSA
jgi:hypothetical protein